MAENFSTSDILVTAANILYAPKGTALPDETTVPVNDFDAWPSGWEHLGYTATPARTSYTYDVFELGVEQSTSPAIQRKTNERAVTDVALSQFSAANLALVTDGTATNTAAGASQKAYSKVVTGGSPNLKEYMFALEGYRPDANGNSQPIRVFFYRGTIRLNGSIEFAKGAGTSIPAQITALTDPTKTVGQQLMEAHIVTGPATS